MKQFLKLITFLICLQIGILGCSKLVSSEKQKLDVVVSTKPSTAKSDCPTGDCIEHNISTQDICEESIAPPQRDSRWHQDLSLQTDQLILDGDIVAYQIRWFNGNWSKWYVPGVNDIDHKYNLNNNTMRRMWSYFYDHEHKYIICKRVEK